MNEDQFGERLTKAREKRELTQADLAKKASLQVAAIGHFERGRRKPSCSNVRALAKALNVSSDYLLGRTENMAGATTAFRGEEDLTDADREHIQLMINLMRERREQSDQ